MRKSTPNYYFLWLTVLPLLIEGCAYRLSNLHTQRPSNIRSVFVEGIYNTSQEPIPHELLWDEIQRAVIASGQLQLSSPDKADAMIRVHIEKSSSTKTGTLLSNIPENVKKDPKDLFSGQSAPPGVEKLKPIGITSNYYEKTAWQSTARVEVYHLKNRALILQRYYELGGDVIANRGELPIEIHHVRHEESFAASFSGSSRRIASRIVEDLLRR